MDRGDDDKAIDSKRSELAAAKKAGGVEDEGKVHDMWQEEGGGKGVQRGREAALPRPSPKALVDMILQQRETVERELANRGARRAAAATSNGRPESPQVVTPDPKVGILQHGSHRATLCHIILDPEAYTLNPTKPPDPNK